jgi:hypothetical protein
LQRDFRAVVSRGFLVSAICCLVALANQLPVLGAVFLYYGVILEKQGGKCTLHVYALLAVEFECLVVFSTSTALLRDLLSRMKLVA